MRQLRRRAGHGLHQRRIPQRGRQVDALLLERAAIVKCSGVAKISDQACPSQNLEALARANWCRIPGCALVNKISCAQAAVHGSPLARRLDLFEIEVVAKSPGQPQRIGAQNSAPAQGLV